MSPRRLGTLVAAICVAASSMAAQPAAPLRVIASNGVKTFVDALVPAYEKASGRRVTLTYGTSSGLVQDIVGGAPFDVVIATADAVQQVGQAGKTAGVATTIGHTPVGLGVKKGAKKPAARTAAELRGALLASKAVTYAGNGASRPHIEAMFVTLGVGDTVKAKAILEQGSNRAIDRVVAGDADLLITLVSEIMPAPGVDLVGPLPPEFRSDVTFAAAVSATATDPAAARALIASLVSPGATPILRQKGLER